MSCDAGMYNGNEVYIEWDGAVLDPFWTAEIDLSASNSPTETTAGSGATHIQRRPGLNDHNISFTVGYFETRLAEYVGKLEIGKCATLIIGPEGQVAGKPVHEQNMILTDRTGPNNSIDQGPVTFSLTFSAAGAPIRTIDADTF